MKKINPVMLMILDGWGINPSKANNAVAAAKTPNLDRLFDSYPHTQLTCSGAAVGLPAGIMGNSEVGHLNIGAGRVVYQTLLRIDRAISDGSFFENPALSGVMKTVLSTDKTLHIMGLVSDGGVHSQLSHLCSLIDMTQKMELPRVCIHVILDGRDTPPDSGAGYVEALTQHIKDKSHVTIASICGRYYAMDRDTRWDRTELAYRLYTEGAGKRETDPMEAVKHAYDRGETDEFVKPIILDSDHGVLGHSDGLIFFNFRADRTRQITRAFTQQNFDNFERKQRLELCSFVCMSQYDEHFGLPVAFGPVHIDELLGEVVSRQNLSQLRIAETEKYAHVTYFFNGGEEEPFPGEDRCLIPSPRHAATYDEVPAMSANEVTDEILDRLAHKSYDLIVVNFANMDMVGHTGVLSAAIKAVETVDACVGRIIPRATEMGGAILVTADHGNSEQMADDKGRAHTSHTLNLVPLILVSDACEKKSLRQGCLGDIAPTILQVMGITKPEAMTGKSLLID